MKFSLLLAILTLPVTSTAQACSCAAPPPPKQALEQAHAVFVARVTKIERGGRFGKTVTMEVSTTWKGIKEKTVTVFTGLGGGDCGYAFQVDKSYLVYAYQSKDRDGKLGPLSTNICTRTRAVESAKGDIDALGPAKMPPL